MLCLPYLLPGQNFVSLNRYVLRAIRYARLLAAQHSIRFVCDQGFDDEKTFAFLYRCCA